MPLAFLLANCGSPPRPDLSLERVQESGALRVAMDASFPPLESVGADGRIVGIDADVAGGIARHLGVHAQILNVASDGLKPALLAGKADAIISSFTPVPEWSHDLAYSESYYDAGPVLAVTSGDADQGAIGVEEGGDGEAPARERWPGRIRSFETIDAAVRALAAGSISAVVLDRPDLALLADESPDLHIVDPPLVSVPYVAAVRKGDRLLLEAINSAVDAMKSDGELDKIVDRPRG